MNIKFWLAVIVILSFFSCKTDPSDLQNLVLDDYSAEYAFPIFHAEVTLDEILSNVQENTTMTVEPDGEINLKYSGDFLGLGSEDIFDIVTAVVPIPVTDTVVHADYDIPNSIEIDFFNLTQGQIGISYESRHEEDVDVEITIPQLTKNGEPYKWNGKIEYEGDTPIQGGTLGSIADYKLTSFGDTLITIRYEAIRESGVRDTLDNFFVVFLNLEYDYAEGFLGDDVYTVAADTIEIDFFKSWANGSVYFEDPKISLTVFNSLGFPIDGKFLFLDIITVKEDVLPLQSTFIDNGISINYPKLSEVGETAETTFSFDKDNSNIREVLGAGPIAVHYDLEAEPNPEGDTSIRGFITDKSEMRVQVDVELPIHGYADDFVVIDTFDVNFQDIDLENAEYAEFKLITENETPLAVKLQLYFADASYQILDSLLIPAQNVVESAAVNADGISMTAESKTIIQEFYKDRLNKIETAKNIFLISSFSTENHTNEQSVKILAEQSVSVRMGMKLGIKN